MEMLYAAIILVVNAITAAWLLVQGSTINASAEVEGRSTPVWGVSLNAFGAFTLVLNVLFVLVILLGGGGEANMISDAAWKLIASALTMMGAGFASALCIMVAAKAGSEMLTERPELSIWSLLFVALGEGLAIYGLIVAILMITS